MDKTPIFVVDAFAGALDGRTLGGNPAAVVLLNAPCEASWMQEVAAEMNLSETAFLSAKSANQFDLRWFTPRCEVELCGHATLASAHVLWEKERATTGEKLQFHTWSGVLTARQSGAQVSLDFPAQDVEAGACPVELRGALGFGSESIQAFRASDDWLLEISEASLGELQPDFAALAKFCARDSMRGVIVTALAGIEHSGVDFVSRFFAPAVGIDEDPVTGSAHTKLAPFWGARLKKREMLGYQASARGGLVRVNWNGARVELMGLARTRLRGEWLD